MDDRNNSDGQPAVSDRPVRAQTQQIGTLQTQSNCATMKRKVEIFSQLVRHMTAIVYLVAELHLGQKPEKL